MKQGQIVNDLKSRPLNLVIQLDGSGRFGIVVYVGPEEERVK